MEWRSSLENLGNSARSCSPAGRSCLHLFDKHLSEIYEEKIDIDATWFLLPAQELSCQSSVQVKKWYLSSLFSS